MIKTINVGFEEKDYKKLVKEKGSKSWHDFILGLTEDC